MSTVGGLRRAKGFACPEPPDEPQRAPAPSRSGTASEGHCLSFLPKFSLSSVGAEGGGEEQSLSHRGCMAGQWGRTGRRAQFCAPKPCWVLLCLEIKGSWESSCFSCSKPDKWDANLEDLPWGSGRQWPARMGPC